MAGLGDVLNTARDALRAQSYGLGVTGQNIANVNTPGYVRRSPLLQSLPLGSQSFGTVTVNGTLRHSDIYTDQRHYSAVGLSSAASENNRLLGHLEAQFDVTSGLDVGTAVSELFSSFSALSTDPSNPTVRAHVLGKAENFSLMLNRAADQVSTYRAQLFQEAQGTANDVNSLAKQLADVTSKISNVEAAGQDASDLKDTRDRMLLDLSELVDVRTFTNNQGQLVIQASGTTLVEGDNYRQLDVGLANDGTFQIFSVTASGARTNVSDHLTGGKLAALRDTHDIHSTATLNSLNNLAYDVATAINNQHVQGYDLQGNTGLQFFDVPSSPDDAARSIKLHADVAGQPQRIAASSTSTGIPGDANNSIALSQLAYAKISGGGTRTAAEAYGDVIADVGRRRQSAQMDAEVREAVAAQTLALKEQASGVNLDEEMIALAKYQRAYQAAARVMTTADSLLEELMNSIGR